MKKVLVFALMVTSMATMAQKMKMVSGDLKNLKGIAQFNLVFDYEGLTVDKFKTEDEFLADKMKKREEKGTDDDFKKSWFSDRQTRYEPKFIESFNKRFENGEIKVDKNLSTAKHTMKVKTIWIYPGYNVGVMRRPALLTTEITIFENANPSNVLAVVHYEKAPGNGTLGMDYNSGYRISEAYAKLAKEFAGDISKKTK